MRFGVGSLVLLAQQELFCSDRLRQIASTYENSWKIDIAKQMWSESWICKKCCLVPNFSCDLTLWTLNLSALTNCAVLVRVIIFKNVDTLLNLNISDIYISKLFRSYLCNKKNI